MLRANVHYCGGPRHGTIESWEVDGNHVHCGLTLQQIIGVADPGTVETPLAVYRLIRVLPNYFVAVPE